ncbi:hypothetical protein ANRL4_02646 [Anaerolineae bacterium]|nr:hypothetical protein ANRL4_02646 [Anaerolineae bacterium]
MHSSLGKIILIGVVAVLCLAALPAVPAAAVPSAKEITITITEAQFNKYLPTVKAKQEKKLEADIIDGGIIVKVFTRWTDLPEYHEHFGVLIRDGKVVTEAGVFSIPGLGGLGYADIKGTIPELIPVLDHNAKIMNRFVQKQISAKAGTRYTPVSVTTGNDKVVIVVSK